MRPASAVTEFVSGGSMSFRNIPLAAALAAAMLCLSAPTQAVEVGGIERSIGKARRVIDKRPK